MYSRLSLRESSADVADPARVLIQRTDVMSMYPLLSRSERRLSEATQIYILSMILPTKHMRTQRTLLGVGAEVIALLDQPKTVSRVWADLKKKRGEEDLKLSFDWFVLSLDLLFSIDAVELNRGRLQLKVARLLNGSPAHLRLSRSSGLGRG